jgi:hypothetical protein
MGDFGLRMFLKERLDLVPIAAIIANSLARGADGQQTPQRLDAGQGAGKFPDQKQAFLLFLPAFGDVALNR